MSSELNNYPPLLEYLFNLGRQNLRSVDSAKWTCARSALDNRRAAAFAGEHLEQYLNVGSALTT